MRGAAFILSAAVACTVATGPARAQERDATLLAAACAGCHGIDGKSQSAIPRLAGQDRQVIAGLMRDYASGAVKGTAMNFIAKGYTAEQIDALATFFAARK